MKKTILIFGGLSVVILLLFQLERWSLFALGGSENMFLIISGILFFIFGLIISRYFFVTSRNKKRHLQKSLLSKQELHVLQLMSDGMSNKEIGAHLFIAETTVKSHVSKILTKLEARRRTEAIKIGRDLEII